SAAVRSCSVEEVRDRTREAGAGRELFPGRHEPTKTDIGPDGELRERASPNRALQQTGHAKAVTRASRPLPREPAAERGIRGPEARAVTRMAWGRSCRWGAVGVLVVAAAGALYWLVTTKPETTPARVNRSFPSAGVK